VNDISWDEVKREAHIFIASYGGLLINILIVEGKECSTWCGDGAIN
jgi:hypothetical protein